MKHLLLIEDNLEIRENTAEILELAGYNVATAENGKIGVELALKKKPDLIICDIMMPVLDGYGVLHLVNKNSGLLGIPFIFLTAKTERIDFRKGMEMGADDYLTKPFSEIELLNAIEGRLHKMEILKKQYKPNPYGVYELISDLGVGQSLQELTGNGNTDHFKKNQRIYSEHNHPLRLFFIESGKVKCFKTNEEGKELIIGLYGAGDFFGYNALFDGSTYKDCTEALEDSEIVMIAKEDFEKLIQSSPMVERKFIQLLAKNISEKEEQLINIAYNSLRKRVADSLMSLQKKYKTATDNNFMINISRSDLAHIAGTAKESLIRTLSDFKNEKLIDIKEGGIEILNQKKLESMIN